MSDVFINANLFVLFSNEFLRKAKEYCAIIYQYLKLSLLERNKNFRNSLKAKFFNFKENDLCFLESFLKHRRVEVITLKY